MTPKGQARKQAIVDAARGLFHERGYHATGIDEIGAAAGITGPGIYRHFDSKDQILATIFDQMWLRLLDTIDRAAKLDAAEAIDLLIHNHVEAIVDRPGDVVLLLNELRSLPAEYQASAAVNDRTYQQAWAAPIRALHPALTADEAIVAARSTMWLITSYDIGDAGDDLDPIEAKTLLSRIAHASIASLS